MSINALSRGDRAPDLTLTAGDGTTVSLQSLWQSGPIILTFLRHFG
jgi:peroxiredoxin